MTLSYVQVPAFRATNVARAVAVILGLSAVVLGFLVWLVYLKKAAGVHSAWVGHLPEVNAGLNSLSTLFLSAGFIAVMSRRYTLHMAMMFSALVTSALFFVCYVIYHNAHGDTLFVHNAVRPYYLAVLISHILMSAAVVPLILLSFYLSLSGRYALHKKVSRYTFPIWLYVSVTGVVVFVMLRTLNHA